MLPTLAVVSRSGAVTDARAEADLQGRRALELLGLLPPTVDAAALRAIVHAAVDRRS